MRPTMNYMYIWYESHGDTDQTIIDKLNLVALYI